MSSSQCRIPRAARKETKQKPDVPLRTSDDSGTPFPSLGGYAAVQGSGEMTNDKTSTPDATVLQIMQEARDIVAGRSDAAPTKEHLEALLLSATFYKAKAAALEEQQYTAQQLQDFRRGEMIHVPELESNCYQCQARAQYLVVGLIVPVLFCPAHARQQPQWNELLACGRVQ